MTTIDYYLEYLLSENWFFVRFCVTQLSNRNLLRSDIFKIGTKSFKLFVISSINVKQKRNQRIPKVPILTAICNFVSQRDKHTIFFVKSYKIQYPISFLSCNHMYVQCLTSSQPILLKKNLFSKGFTWHLFFQPVYYLKI